MSEPDLLPPGTPIDLDNCHREPIHTPGAVQGHGVLLAAAADGTVVQASVNAESILERDPVGRALADVLGAEVAAAAADRARAGDVPNLRPVRTTVGGRAVDVFAYGDGGDGLVVELEPIAAGDPGDIAHFQSDVAAAVAALQDAGSVTELLETAVRLVRDLTGFDRVWAYRFEADEHGVIVAEDRRPDVPGFLGLHYPATDIPVQARRLFLVNRVRLIADVDGAPAAIEPVVNPGTGEWLDLTRGVLRAVSPMHIEYLRNMGATASMSVALPVGGRLWGLLSAHHYSGPKLLSQRARAACELLGLVCATQLTALERLEQAQRETRFAGLRAELVERVAHAESVADGLTGDALLAVCDADGAAVCVGDTVRLCGATPPEDAVLALADALRERELTEAWATDRAGEELAGVALGGRTSGVLAVPLTRGAIVVWFRDEWPHTVTWGGKEAAGVPDGSRLNPEWSWREWSESVSGHSRPWRDEELASAAALRAALGTLLLTRSEQLAALNAELERSNRELDAFSFVVAHDLREPLRGIHNFATFVTEDFGAALGADGAEQIATIQRLAARMSGLLDSLLEYSQIRTSAIAVSDVRLGALADDVREMLHGRLAAEDAELIVDDPDAMLAGDHDGLLHILSNLVSNGLKYNTSPLRQVRVDTVRTGDPERLAVRVRDNGIGIAADQHDNVFVVFRRLHGRDAFGGGTGAGLTIARRIAERHGGDLWIESSGPDGTTFCFTAAA